MSIEMEMILPGDESMGSGSAAQQEPHGGNSSEGSIAIKSVRPGQLSSTPAFSTQGHLGSLALPVLGQISMDVNAEAAFSSTVGGFETNGKDWKLSAPKYVNAGTEHGVCLSKEVEFPIPDAPFLDATFSIEACTDKTGSVGMKVATYLDIAKIEIRADSEGKASFEIKLGPLGFKGELLFSSELPGANSRDDALQQADFDGRLP